MLCRSLEAYTCGEIMNQAPVLQQMTLQPAPTGTRSSSGCVKRQWLASLSFLPGWAGIPLVTCLSRVSATGASSGPTFSFSKPLHSCPAYSRNDTCLKRGGFTTQPSALPMCATTGHQTDVLALMHCNRERWEADRQKSTPCQPWGSFIDASVQVQAWVFVNCLSS